MSSKVYMTQANELYLALTLVCIVLYGSLISCKGSKAPSSQEAINADSIAAAEKAHQEDIRQLPADVQPSVANVVYDITHFDTLTSGRIDYADHIMWNGEQRNQSTLYDGKDGWFTFRGTSMRNAAYEGCVSGTPSRIEKVWTFQTAQDFTQTNFGTWGGGTGWTGQPVYVKWPQERMQQFRQTSPALTADFAQEEIMVGSLCGMVYFINWQTGKSSRQPLNVTNPVKGSISLDPTLNGNLYVGQGIPKVYPMGQMAWNLNTHKQTFFSGHDRNAWLGWGAFDSSPVRIGKFLFWPGENGTIYKYLILDNNGGLRLHTTLRLKSKRGGCAGVENSLCVYKNYGWFGTNNGNVFCIDLNTMQPLWHYDNLDDIDATIVCEVVNGTPFLYCGCEVDRQGMAGVCRFVKLNGLTGEEVWRNEISCKKLNINTKHFDGGLYSTPLLGSGDCDSLIFANICQRSNNEKDRTACKAEFTAIHRSTGEVVYRTQLPTFAWSSPVGFVNETGQFFVFTGDSSGNAYLIEGKTGRILFQKRMCNNFESSPVVVGNELVVGSRGSEIIKYAIR